MSWSAYPGISGKRKWTGPCSGPVRTSAGCKGRSRSSTSRTTKVAVGSWLVSICLVGVGWAIRRTDESDGAGMGAGDAGFVGGVARRRLCCGRVCRVGSIMRRNQSKKAIPCHLLKFPLKPSIPHSKNQWQTLFKSGDSDKTQKHDDQWRSSCFYQFNYAWEESDFSEVDLLVAVSAAKTILPSSILATRFLTSAWSK